MERLEMTNSTFYAAMKSAGTRQLLGIINTAHTIRLSTRAFFFDRQRKRNAGNSQDSLRIRLPMPEQAAVGRL
jgi:hypothetical protein